MKKGVGSQSTIIIGPSKSVLVYALHNLEKRPRPCPISDVCAKIIIIIICWLNDWHHFVRYCSCSQCHPEALSIHAAKGLFKIYKSQLQIGRIFSSLLDDQRKKIQLWSLHAQDLWWHKDGLLSGPVWAWRSFCRLRAGHIFLANYRKSLDYPFLEFSQWYYRFIPRETLRLTKFLLIWVVALQLPCKA